MNDTLNFKSFFSTLLVLSTIGFVATDIYLPSLPFIRNAFDCSNSMLQSTLTLYLFSFSFSQLFYGPLSDRFGRRKISILSLNFSFLGTILCIAAFNIKLLLFGRILQGMAFGGGVTVGRAVMRDVYSGNRLAQIGSLISVGSALFLAVIPTLGGWIQSRFGWRMNFIVVLFFSLLALMLVFYWLPETNRNPDDSATKLRNLKQNYLTLLKSPIFVGYNGCSSLAFGGFVAYLAVSPFIFQEVIELSPIGYGSLSFFMAAGIILGGFSNSVLVKFLNCQSLLFIGILTMTFSGFGMLGFALLGKISVLVIMGPMIIYIIGAVLTFTNAFSGAFQPFPNLAGSAGALYSCFQILGGSLIAAIASLFPISNQIPLSIILISIGIGSFLLFLFARRADKVTS